MELIDADVVGTIKVKPNTDIVISYDYIWHSSIKETYKEVKTNCPNCGALLNQGKCEYCGAIVWIK